MTDTDREAGYERADAWAREMDDLQAAYERSDAYAREMGDPDENLENLYRDVDDLKACVGEVTTALTLAQQLRFQAEALARIEANQERAELHAKQTRELVFKNMLAAAIARDPGLPAWLAKQKQRRKDAPLSGAEIQSVTAAILDAVKRDPTIDLADPASWQQVFPNE